MASMSKAQDARRCPLAVVCARSYCSCIVIDALVLDVKLWWLCVLERCRYPRWALRGRVAYLTVLLCYSVTQPCKRWRTASRLWWCFIQWARPLRGSGLPLEDCNQRFLSASRLWTTPQQASNALRCVRGAASSQGERSAKQRSSVDKRRLCDAPPKSPRIVGAR